MNIRDIWRLRRWRPIANKIADGADSADRYAEGV